MDEPRARKVMLYVRSIEVPGGQFVDREGAVHACAQAGSTPFDGLKGAAHLLGRVFTDADWQAINIAQVCQDTMKIDIEIVDISQSFWQRMKLRRQGVKETPQFLVDGQCLPPIKKLEELTNHL